MSEVIKEAKKVTLKDTVLEKGDKVADIRKRVEATATEKHKFRKTGEKTLVSPVLYEYGKKKGTLK